MTKFLKISASILISFLTVFLIAFSTYAIITKNAVLDPKKLTGAGQNVTIYDDDGNEIISASLDAKNKSVSLKNLQPHTVNAFIASEDRTFYKHSGLNYKRMIKALFKNIAARSFKEGASTISQQLIKNTHLSNDKTIKRKLNEIKLTKKLEKKYTKDEILEMYLNTIYFGHNCYGLQSAAEFYFNKKAENLSLTESATIVGLLTSPNNYSPFKNPEKSLLRRNIVLKSMLSCGYIDNGEYSAAINEPLNAVKSTRESVCGDYVSAIFDEIDEIDFDYYALTDGCKIKTYLKADLQKFIESTEYKCDNSVIVTDNLTGGVNAYKSTIGGAKRQPGSTVKPLFVYAPAIEEKLINPYTKILDEKVDFNGYSPENYDKKYHGFISVAESLKNSYNVPAIKTLNALTLPKCEKYLTAMDIKLDDEEKNLSLALGGMKYGLTIQEIADKYSIFPNGGNYRPSHFIKEIVSKDGKTLYKNQTVANHVYSKGTCSLINDMLLQTTKSGTAKKLKDLNFDVAAKTGTCGNADGNTDAYAIGYTSQNCVAVWLGNADNSRSAITGGKDCCNVLKPLLREMYSDGKPYALDTTTDTVTVGIDQEEYNENNKFVIADNACPKLNILNIKVLKGCEPQEQSDRFTNPSILVPTISVKNNVVYIELCHAKYYSFIVKRGKNGIFETIYDGNWQETIIDNPSEGYYSYIVTPYYKNGHEVHFGKEIILPSVNLSGDGRSPQIKIPDIAYKDWYNQ
ncbi:MAG: transglycosylase domain-containing protein [Clostridia bacterium]|nr:transglycosylase domain-containing protein [Clostridia bacterium]